MDDRCNIVLIDEGMKQLDIMIAMVGNSTKSLIIIQVPNIPMTIEFPLLLIINLLLSICLKRNPVHGFEFRRLV